jgi:hypothetical protein
MDAPLNTNAYAPLYGTNNNYSAIPANMMNASAADEFDWGAVVTNGIKGAAYNAIGQLVNGAYASGQLQAPVNYQPVQAPMSTTTLLLLGVGAYLLLKGD